MYPHDSVTLKHLRCFIEVYHRGNVADAARALGITQPAASRRLSDLETLLGVALFDRHGRRLVPNATAGLLVRYAEAAVVKLRNGLDLLVGDTETDGTVLSVGALPTVAGTLIPRAVLRLRQAAPGLTLRIETGAGDQLLPLLRAGRLDAVVGRMAPVASLRGLTFETLYQDRLAFAARHDHPLAGAPIGVQELLAYPMICPPPSAVIRAIVEEFLAARGATLPRDRIETTAVAVAVPLLLASDAVWAISKGVAEPETGPGRLALLALDTVDTIGSIGITWRADEDDRTDLVLLRDVLRDLAGQ